MEEVQKLKALLIGGTGATGRELVDLLLKSNKWSDVSVIVRNPIDRWEKYTPEMKNKLQVIKVSSLDELENTEKWNNFTGYSSVFNALGTKTGLGDDIFYKVDYTYVYWSALIAQSNLVPHFSLVTSGKANPKSMFMYLRVKGQIEEAVKALNIPRVSVFRPGAIQERDNDSRIIETIVKYMPFWPKITTTQIAQAMILEAESIHAKQQLNTNKQNFTYENQDMLDMCKKQQL